MSTTGPSRVLILSAMAVACAALPALAAEEIAAAVKSAERSLVVVRGPGGSIGTGVIVDAKGHIATTAQLVRGVLEAEVELDGATRPARVVASQSLADLVVLQIDPPPAADRAVRPAEATELGQRVIVVGAPAGGPPALSVGYITGKRAARILFGGLVSAELLESDAATRPDLAGSPVFDATGGFVGLATGISSASSTSAGYGYVVSAATIRLLLDDPVPWPGLEALFVDAASAALLNIPQEGALLVQRVVPGSYAETLGLRGGTVSAVVGGERVLLGGDAILEIGGIKLSEADAAVRIGELLRSRKPGTALPVAILRHGKRMELSFAPAP